MARRAYHRRVSSRHHDVYHPANWIPPEGSWASSDAIRRTMLKNRNRDTAPEVALRSAIHRLGLRYRVAARPIPGIRRTADLVFPRRRIAVFVDGCFWHGCPVHFVMPKTNEGYWRPKVARNVERDRSTDAALHAAGWEVIRIWEHESVDEAAKFVEAVVKNRVSSRPRTRPPSPRR